ncbi:TetR/AcrR family transcriptional regulator [Nakamurella endophytica]|uniref:TetR family transcriptional regulator n=1 Tax=Nakamurella endophytica TaxID=1748367 RepID=A0A917T8V4_9ACTN|nr:TetR/AcrR family transcriptional regulator [Nakamurella endophytica]GGM14810.1 TetR family transcriptional regulator [Nakamurella endophytica]
MTEQDGDEVALPHAIALTWGMAEAPQRGPKRELTIERIVDAAIEIADTDGLGAVSMARVASALGFTTMSLYRYVTSKDDLLLLMEDAVYAVPGLGRPEVGAPWRPAMRALVDACMAVVRAHPWVARSPIRGVPLTPNNLWFVDYTLTAMAPLPLTTEEKLAALLSLTGLARILGGYEAEIVAGRAAGAEPPLTPAALGSFITDERFPALAPVVRAGGYGGGGQGSPGGAVMQAEFDFGVERLLDGVEHVVAEREAGRAVGSPAVSVAAGGQGGRRGRAPSEQQLRAAAKDPEVRAAVQQRREAEHRLRELQRQERERIDRAVERAAAEEGRSAR